jgi:hypothetical protein
MSAEAELQKALKRAFKIKPKHVQWRLDAEERLVAQVGALYFRQPGKEQHGDLLEAWNGWNWVAVKNLRALGYALAEAAALGNPPELH